MLLRDRFIKALLQCIYCIIFSLTLTGSGCAYRKSIEAVLWPLTLAASGIVSPFSSNRDIASWRRSWNLKSLMPARLTRRTQDCLSVPDFTGNTTSPSLSRLLSTKSAAAVKGTIRPWPFLVFWSSAKPLSRLILLHLSDNNSPVKAFDPLYFNVGKTNFPNDPPANLFEPMEFDWPSGWGRLKAKVYSNQRNASNMANPKTECLARSISEVK